MAFLKDLVSLFEDFEPEYLCICGRPEETEVSRLCIFRDYYRTFFADVFYAARISSLQDAGEEEDMPENLICICDVPPGGRLKKRLSRQCRSVVLLSGSADFERLFRRSDRLLDRRLSLEEGNAELIDLLYEGADLRKLIDAASRWLGNPVSMFDVDFTMIGTASKTDLQMGKVDKRAFETEDGRFYLTVDGITALHSSPRLETAAQSRRPVFYPPGTEVREGYLSGEPYFAEGFLDCAVRVQGYVTAYFSAGGIYRPVFEEDVRKAEQLSKVFSVRLGESRFWKDNRGDSYESFLQDLLAGKISDSLAAAAHLRYLNKNMGSEYFIFTARRREEFPAEERDRSKTPPEIPSEMSPETLPEVSSKTPPETPSEVSPETPSKLSSKMPSKVQASLKSFFEKSISVRYGDDVVLLVGDPPSEQLFVPVSSLTLFLEGNGMEAGVSGCFSDLASTPRFYLQSVRAMEIGGQTDRKKTVYRYSDYSLFHMFEICSRDMELNDICHPVILALKKKRDEGDAAAAELMRTLQTYLRHMCDTRKTAEALHIHRNTLYYRLNQLEELLGDGWENGAEVLRLMLSFEVIGYFAAFGGR